MDQPGITRAALDTSLRYIRGVNQRLGGVEALLGHLRAWSRRWPRTRPITLLDIGTGSADLPLAARKWASGAGFDLRVTAIDKHETTLAIAREHIAGSRGITLVEADALDLDNRFGTGEFDYVHAGLFLHHLPDDQVVQVLKSMHRICAAGLVWNDLIRSRLGQFVVTALTLGRPGIVRHDARVSVEGGFVREEVDRMAVKAGIDYCTYKGEVLTHRFTLAGEKKSAWR